MSWSAGYWGWNSSGQHRQDSGYWHEDEERGWNSSGQHRDDAGYSRDGGWNRSGERREEDSWWESANSSGQWPQWSSQDQEHHGSWGHEWNSNTSGWERGSPRASRGWEPQ